MRRAGFTTYLTAASKGQVKAAAHNMRCARTAPTAARVTGPVSKYRDIMKSPTFRLSRVLPDMFGYLRIKPGNRDAQGRSSAQQFYRRTFAVKTVGRLAAAV